MTISSAPRRALTSAAVLATSVAATLSGVAGAAHATAAGDAASPLTLSFGTNNIQVGAGDVTFASTVTDAAWSPDGSRIAYVDGDGNIATANASGGDVLVLTTKTAGTVRSHPAWEDGGSEIVFSEIVNGGAAKLMSVEANGLAMGKPAVEQPVGETAQDTAADTNPDALFISGGKNTLVYEHAGAGGAEVWILDRNTRGPQGVKLADGSQPSIAPDGSQVAFVDATGQIETIGIPVPLDASNAPVPVFTKVTNDAAKHFGHPTWSPDGKTVAFEGQIQNPGSVAWVGVDTETAPAAGGVTPAVVAQRGPNVPAYQPLNKDVVHRVAGTDRLQTAIDASQAAWPSATPQGRTASSVVLSRSDQFADALGGSALAFEQNGPLLLTSTAELKPEVQAEITRVLGVPDPQWPQTVFLLGGEKALSPSVAAQVAALGYRVQRLGGSDRYSTSTAIADYMTTNADGSLSTPPRIMVATGVNFADALSAGAAAQGGVVVLTADGVMPPATANFLAKYDGKLNSPQVYAIGGQANTALHSIGFGWGAQGYTDIHGDNRYATSLLVAKTFFDGPGKVGFATGLNWADALSGGAMMGRLNGPLLLTDPVNGPSLDALTWLRHSAPQLGTALIFGGYGAVGGSVDPAIGTAISGPAGYSETDQPMTFQR